MSDGSKRSVQEQGQHGAGRMKIVTRSVPGTKRQKYGSSAVLLMLMSYHILFETTILNRGHTIDDTKKGHALALSPTPWAMGRWRKQRFSKRETDDVGGATDKRQETRRIRKKERKRQVARRMS